MLKGVIKYGKRLNGKEQGVGISQQKNGLYSARFVDKFGKCRQKRFKKLQECRQWIADATYVDEHSNNMQAADIMVDAWFDYWIDIKKKTVRPNTVRNYTERYNRNIKKIIGKMLLSEVKPLHCQNYSVIWLMKIIGQARSIRQELLYSVGEWRIGEPKSKSGYRTIPLTDEVIDILKRQKEKNKKIKIISLEWSEFVFLCRKGTPIKNSTYDTALFKICDKAQIPRFSMHVLRHTFATRCIEGGMKPKTLQIILGHSNIGITMNLYVHTTEEEKLKEIELVADALNVV